MELQNKAVYIKAFALCEGKSAPFSPRLSVLMPLCLVAYQEERGSHLGACNVRPEVLIQYKTS